MKLKEEGKYFTRQYFQFYGWLIFLIIVAVTAVILDGIYNGGCGFDPSRCE